MTDVTSADFLSQVGKRTPLFARFSTTAGEKGSPETIRDVRGMAFKMYTNEGNLDWAFLSQVREREKKRSSFYCLFLLLCENEDTTCHYVPPRRYTYRATTGLPTCVSYPGGETMGRPAEAKAQHSVCVCEITGN